MASMFDTILELPLFKGIGETQLSQLLEKTKMEFLKFNSGDLISRDSEQVKAIDFIISGEARHIFTLENYDIKVEEILGAGTMMGAMNLFGLVTDFFASSEAIGQVSILRIDKNQYMNILQSDKIYILNFVNYLSAMAQKSANDILRCGDAGIGRTLHILADILVSRRAERVILKGEDSEIARYCGVPLAQFQAWKSKEAKLHRIAIDPEGIILRSPELVSEKPR